MAYVKTIWDESEPRSLTNLNNLETQYDEAVAEGINLRADNTKQLRAEVAASEPAGVAGQIFFNTTNGLMYYHNGTVWVPVPGVAGTMLYNEGEGEDNWVQGFSEGTGAFTKEVDHLKIQAGDSGSDSMTAVNDSPLSLSADDIIIIEAINDGSANVANYSGFAYGSDKVGNLIAGTRITSFLINNTFPRAIADQSDRQYHSRFIFMGGGVDMSGDNKYLKLVAFGSATRISRLKIYRVFVFSLAEFVKLFR